MEVGRARARPLPASADRTHPLSPVQGAPTFAAAGPTTRGQRSPPAGNFVVSPPQPSYETLATARHSASRARMLAPL